MSAITCMSSLPSGTVCVTETKSVSVSLYNHPLSHSEPKYTMSPESCSNLFQEAGNLGSFGNNMMLEVQSFHCLLSLSVTLSVV